jgi:Ca-activated chloride channel family protein
MRTLVLSGLVLALATSLSLGCTKEVSAPPGHPMPVAVAPAQPPPPAADLVGYEASPANRFARADQRGEALVRLRLTARAMRDAPRPPINLGLVVDTSGSMEGDAIRDARAASLLLLDSLQEGDRLAVVSFDTDTQVLVPSTRLDKNTILRAREQIGAMKARGTTDLAGGLRVAIDQVARGFEPNGVNRIVLLGDGVPNDEAPVLPLAQLAARDTIPITVLGLGVDYNETLMNAIAQQSGGKYHFVRESSAVAGVFKDELLRLRRVIARNAVLRLMPGPGVTVEEVLGVPATRGAETTVSLGDLSEGEQRDVVVRLSVAGRRAGSVEEIMDSELSFDAMTAGGVRVAERSFVSERSTADAKELAAGLDVDVERSAVRVDVAAKIVSAIALARGGNLPQALSVLDDAEREAREGARTLDDAELAEKAKTFAVLRKELPAMVPPPVPPSPVAGAPEPPRPQPPTSQAVIETQAAAVNTIQGPN